MPDPSLLDDIPALVDAIREEAGPEMVPSRVDAEQEAREFLDRHAGAMSREQVIELGKILNRGSWGGSIKHNRFLPALSTPLVEQMTEDIDRFNEILVQLWRGDDDEAIGAADVVFRDGTALPGSGRSFPSLILYVRDPDKYAIWFNSIDKGLAVLTDYTEGSRHDGTDAYLAFAEKTRAFASEHGLQPQEIDAVLSQAHRLDTRRRSEQRVMSATPVLGSAAFAFLQDLAANNSKEWMDANRSRYESELRDPLAAVLQAVADRYVVGLDPAINATVKRDDVMARIYKWSVGDPYYEYLWGAFSRNKKQEDVQLYVNVNTDFLHFGLFLGSAPSGAIASLVASARSKSDGWVRDLVDRLPAELVWDQDGEALVKPAGVEDLVEWAQGPSPHARLIVDSSDPLVDSESLVSVIGDLFVDLHPLAAIAWGDEVDDVGSDSTETAQPDYPFERLVRDTLLPESLLREWVDLLEDPDGKRAGLFFGPPGTGKTHVAEKLARHLAGTDGEVATVQFHPSFSYEDFIEGLRPKMEEGEFGYEVRPGVFHEFCERARGKEGTYVFVIDEINRAELGSVLGEVMMLVEYRDRSLPLPYSQRSFSIPRNVVLLATMNTADRSLALVDFALRRRFNAFSMLPDRGVLSAWSGPSGDLAVAMFDLVQEQVADHDYAPGHTYWMTSDQSAEGLDRLWRYELRPYLSEYWFESQGRLEQLEAAVLALFADGA